MKVFYHNDLDGRCAAHVINSYDDWPTASRDMRAINYGMEFPFDEIEKDERVYILDYSIEPEEMLRLLAITKNVIWVDHHKTAIEKYKDFPHKIKGCRLYRFSGCVGAYVYLRKEYPERIPIDTPEYLLLVSDRDTWTWDYGDRTKHFCTGMQAYDTFPRAPVWNSLRYDENFIEGVILEGRTIQCYKDRIEQDYIRANGFWINTPIVIPVTGSIPSYKCYAVNGLFDSKPFEAVVPEADIWITFRYTHSHWKVSLYTDKDIDVSAIAEEYVYKGKRGGGHTQAAGFTCEWPPFLEQDIIDPDKLMEINMR